MKIHFYKYHGSGNDFIILDGRELNGSKEGASCSLNGGKISSWCHRRYGIGADGLIVVQADEGDLGFTMVYYNSDGKLSTFCGNGSRCAVHFAKANGFFEGNKCQFKFGQDVYRAKIKGKNISIQMKNIEKYGFSNNFFLVDTGSPHLVIESNEKDLGKLIHLAKEIRFSPKFRKEGINVNFLLRSLMNDNPNYYLHTYERGVEDLTYSCGTGAVAAAVFLSLQENRTGNFPIVSMGGKLEVEIGQRQEDSFSEIWLCGEAVSTFWGTLDLSAE